MTTFGSPFVSTFTETFNSTFYERNGESSNSLKSLVASTVFDLDATLVNSWSGTGQYWKNLVATPADGSLQSVYDFQLGSSDATSTADPVFNGSPGSNGGFWTTDATQFFQIRGSNPAFVENLHKTTGGGPFWGAMSFRFVQNDGSQRYWGTQSSSTSTGVGLNANSNEAIAFVQGDGTTALSVTSSPSTLVNGQDYIIIISCNGSNTRRWINGSTKAEAAMAFNTTVAASSGAMRLLCTTSGGSDAASGTRLYSFAMGNSYIDDAEASLIFNMLSNRRK